MRRHTAKWPSKAERQAGDRPGHTGFSESLIWDRDDIPSLQHLLSGALCLKGGIIFDCNIEVKCERDKGGQREVEVCKYRWKNEDEVMEKVAKK